MNSVSMPSRPPRRASSASSETMAGETVVEMERDPIPLVAAVARAGAQRRLVRRRAGGAVGAGGRRRGRLLVGPAAVTRVELPRGVLLVALAVAAHPDAE